MKRGRPFSSRGVQRAAKRVVMPTEIEASTEDRLYKLTREGSAFSTGALADVPKGRALNGWFHNPADSGVLIEVYERGFTTSLAAGDDPARLMFVPGAVEMTGMEEATVNNLDTGLPSGKAVFKWKVTRDDDLIDRAPATGTRIARAIPNAGVSASTSVLRRVRPGESFGYAVFRPKGPSLVPRDFTASMGFIFTEEEIG